jgi:cell division protein FtsN
MYKGQILNGLAWLIVVPIGYIMFIVPGAILHLCCIIGASMEKSGRPRSLVLRILVGLVVVLIVSVIAASLLTAYYQSKARSTGQLRPETGSAKTDANEPQALLAKAYDRRKNNRYDSALAPLKELQRKYPDFQPDKVSAAVNEFTLAKAEYDKEHEEERTKYAKEQKEKWAKRKAEAKQQRLEQEEKRAKGEAEAKQLAEQQRLEKEQKAREKEEALAGMDAAAAKMISEGLVYSFDPSLGQVRIDPSFWITLPLETKQTFVFFFSGYFAVKQKTNGLAEVTVLSNRNDRVLAKRSVWGGIQILE